MLIKPMLYLDSGFMVNTKYIKIKKPERYNSTEVNILFNIKILHFLVKNNYI